MPSPGAQRAGAGFDAGPSHSGPGGPGGAGGLGTGTAEAVGDLAGALADALAGAQVDTFGSYATQDAEAQQGGQLSPGEEQRNEAAIEAEAQAAAQSAYDDIMGTSSGLADASVAALGGFQDQSVRPGYEATSVGTGVEDFTGGGYANAPATSDLSFGAYGQQTQPSGDVLSPGEQGRVDAGGYQDVLGSNTGLAQANIANLGGFSSPTAAGTPGYAQPVGMGQVDTYTNMPMAEAFTSPTQPEGALSASQPGMITAGTTGPGPTEGTINEWSGLDVPGTTLPGATTAAYDAGTPVGTAAGTAEGQVELPSGVQDQIQRIPGDTTVTQLETGTPEYHAAQKEFLDKSIMQASEGLDQKAKEMREKHGLFSKEYQQAQRLANAFKSLDQYSKAYSGAQGGSFLGSLLSGAMPLGAALKGIEGWLTSKGMYNKQTGADLRGILEKAMEEGNLDSVMRDLQGGGPSDEDVEGPKEVRSFIQQYPWAAELDPKYIKYLIDNPAALQDLLGEGPGGGDQEITGGQVINGEGPNNAASTPMTAPNLAANEYPPGFPGMDNLPANWQDEGYTWKDPNNPNLSYSIIA